MDTNDQYARERDHAERIGAAEPSVIELMNGPKRPSEQRRKTVLWVGLAFASSMVLVTVYVIGTNGLNFLALITLALLLMLAAAMIGALRYKGVDPIAQFDAEQASRRTRPAASDDIWPPVEGGDTQNEERRPEGRRS